MPEIWAVCSAKVFEVFQPEHWNSRSPSPRLKIFLPSGLFLYLPWFIALRFLRHFLPLRSVCLLLSQWKTQKGRGLSEGTFLGLLTSLKALPLNKMTYLGDGRSVEQFIPMVPFHELSYRLNKHIGSCLLSPD